MARVCDICGKSKKSGNNVTFSHRAIKRTWAPNLKRVRAVVDGTTKRIKVCTRCLRSGAVVRPDFQ
ncbi:MAG: 50S ribosomal protein L28 [Tissierellia bacterium]|nr:50S ribosomal protein L28 [Tissierellia bacterium]